MTAMATVDHATIVVCAGRAIEWPGVATHTTRALECRFTLCGIFRARRATRSVDPTAL